jgi:hypothetical protein
LGVDDDVRKAARRWKQIIDRELSGEEVTVEVKADTKKAEADIEKAAKDKTVTVDVDADTAAAEAKIDALSRDRKVELKVDVDKGAGALTGSLGGLASTAADVGTPSRRCVRQIGGVRCPPKPLLLGAYLADFAGTSLLLFAGAYLPSSDAPLCGFAHKRARTGGGAVALRRRFAGAGLRSTP